MRTVDELIAAVHGLSPSIEQAKPAFDRDRGLPPDLVVAMHDIGLFHLWLPRELGGPALNLCETIRVLEALAQLDGAPAWCASIATTYSRLGAFLPRHAAQRIFVEERAIVGGAFAGGHAEIAPGGFRFSGRMRFSSGIGHSTWAIGGGPVSENGRPKIVGDGIQEMRTMLYPIDAVTVLDTWDVGGLRGTGSHDHSVENLFVPLDQTVVDHGHITDCAGGFYRIPAYTTYPVPIAAVPLGVARAALTHFYRIAGTKIPRSGTPLWENAHVQTSIGRAEASLRSARAFMFETAGDLDHVSEAGVPITVDQRISLRLACAQVAAAAKEAVQIVYDAAGGSSVYEASGIQRCFRDIYAAVQHVQVQTVNFQWAGQLAMGQQLTTSRY